MDLKDKGPAREFFNLGPSLTNLGSFEYGMDCVDYEYSNKLLNSTDRPKLHLASIVSAMAQVQELRLGSYSYQNVITPNALGSALSAFSSTCLSKLTLHEAVVRRNDLLGFLGHCQNSLQELYFLNVSLIHRGWRALFSSIKTRKLKGSAKRLFGLCKSGNFVIMFEKTSGRSARRPFDDTLHFDQNNDFRTRRYERGPRGSIMKSMPKRRRLLEKMLQLLRMPTIQWAGAYFANELDETLNNTKEIRTWE
ncbi:hypothetical protein IWX90DRAFT_105387 [Phyllosticta citrichinensis]|uniref:Uncharacterized protein n=1 Tax=Phyllosticta citrichinensis TaxID=1130410 RepID=A0ABR1Y277_9PEZI